MKVFLATLAIFLSLVSNSRAQNFAQWLSTEEVFSAQSVLNSISPAGAARGIVIASPSTREPNYYFHWTRDAALTMDAVVQMHSRTTDPALKERFHGMLREYAALSRRQQVSSDLGNTKFNIDGTPDTNWMNPQNDGPALRAVTLMHFANQLLATGNRTWVRENLYDGSLTTQSVIKADLEFVAHHWRDPSYDLWEEVIGDHFYTRATQHRALVEGAIFAREMGDPGAATFYEQQAAALMPGLCAHWNERDQYFHATLNIRHNAPAKTSTLDLAILLAVLHGGTGTGCLDVTDSKILSSVAVLRQSFVRLYGINRRTHNLGHESLAPAIGRYVDDRYDGVAVTQNSRGNPWVLGTLAFAEYHFRLANRYSQARRIRIDATNRKFFEGMIPSLPMGGVILAGDPRFPLLVSAIRGTGDAYLRRVRFHANPDGSLSEQMHRDTGFMRGAHDLTWNYVGFLTAIFARH